MARYDDPQFIIDQNLDPNIWHRVGDPVVVPDKYGAPPTTPRGQNNYTITLIGPGGETRKVTMQPTGPGVNAPNVGLNQLDWNVTGVEQGVTPSQANTSGLTPQTAEDKARQEIAASQATAAKAAQDLADLQKLDQNRQKNVGSRGLYMTDEEIAAMDKQLRDQGLTQQQIDAQLKIAADNNQNSRISNEISATNAATSAFVAQKNAEIAAARLKLDSAGQDLQSQRDAATEFQNAWLRAHAEITDAQAQQKIDLDKLTQQQANAVAQAQVASTQQANVLRGQEGAETGRHNVATEQAQAAATQQAAVSAAQQTAANAASSVYGNELQAKTAAGTVGGNLLANRATAANNLISNILSGAAGMSQGSAGRYGTLGGGLHALPAGFSGADLVGGAFDYMGSQFGGQNTLDAAAAMVRNAAPGSELTPMGQAAIGVLHQAFDRVKDLTAGVAGPNGSIQRAPTTTLNTAGAPTTVGAAAAQPEQAAAPAAVVIQPQAFGAAVPGQNYDASVAYTGGVMPWNAQPGAAIPVPIRAPTTMATPTVLVGA